MLKKHYSRIKIIIDKIFIVSGLPDWVRVGVITSDGGDDPSWLFPLSDSNLIMALRQNRTFIHIIHIDGDSCRGCRSISASDQSHWVLSAKHQDVLTLTFKVQHLCSFIKHKKVIPNEPGHQL